MPRARSPQRSSPPWGSLALDADVEGSEVIEHHAAAVEQGLGDEGLDAVEHGHRVTLGHGGGEGDIIHQIIEGVVTILHCSILVVGYIGVLGVAASVYFVDN